MKIVFRKHPSTQFQASQISQEQTVNNLQLNNKQQQQKYCMGLLSIVYRALATLVI